MLKMRSNEWKIRIYLQTSFNDGEDGHKLTWFQVNEILEEIDKAVREKEHQLFYSNDVGEKSALSDFPFFRMCKVGRKY